MAKQIPEEEQAPPLNMGNLITKARNDWEAGHKDEAFHTVLSGMILLSKGVAKCITHVNEYDETLDRIKKSYKPEEKE